jgi:hypothetical protein
VGYGPYKRSKTGNKVNTSNESNKKAKKTAETRRKRRRDVGKNARCLRRCQAIAEQREDKRIEPPHVGCYDMI